MKRYILVAVMSLLLFAGSASAADGGQSPQKKDKSEAELFMQKVSRTKSREIDYAYISTSMFRQMFNMLGADVQIQGISNPLGSIKCMRRFVTTGKDGYRLLADAMSPFLQEDESVMGMELVALNREDGMLNIIYSGGKDILVINVGGDDVMAVVFIAGLTYDAFMKMSEGGMDFDFGF